MLVTTTPLDKHPNKHDREKYRPAPLVRNRSQPGLNFRSSCRTRAQMYRFVHLERVSEPARERERAGKREKKRGHGSRPSIPESGCARFANRDRSARTAQATTAGRTCDFPSQICTIPHVLALSNWSQLLQKHTHTRALYCLIPAPEGAAAPLESHGRRREDRGGGGGNLQR